MIKRLKSATISKKLIFPFSLTIILFAGAVVYANYAFAQAEARHRHNVESVFAGTGYVIEIHRSFTEFAALSKNSFLDDIWRKTADEELIREFEAYITSSYRHITDLARRYMRFAENDGTTLEIEQELVTYSISKVFSSIEEIYNYFNTHFFSQENAAHSPDIILHQIYAAEEALFSALSLSLSLSENANNQIYNYIHRTRAATAILSFAAIVVVIILLFSIVKAFFGRIKKIEKMVADVKKGDFAACIANRANDEISGGILEIINIFMILIEEIHNASVMTKSGVAGARIDTKGFEGGYLETASAINFLLNSIEESNAINQLLFDSLPLVVNFWDKNLNLIDCNSEAARRFGLSGKKEYKDKFFELSPEFQPDGEKSDEKIKRMFAECMKGSKTVFEWLHQDIHGNLMPSEITAFVAEYKGDAALFTYTVDLREIKESLKKEEEANKRVQMMFDSAPLLIEYWDENFSCIDSNETVADMYGLSKEEYNKRRMEFFPEYQPDGVPTKDFWENYLKKTMQEGSTGCSLAGKKSDGSLVYMDVIGMRMELNDKPVIITYSNDVTELKESRRRTQEAEERTQLMLNSAPIACYLVNADFEAIDCNKETLHFFEFESKEEGISKFAETFLKHYPEEMKWHFETAIEMGYDRFEWGLQKQVGRRFNDSSEEVLVPVEIVFTRVDQENEFFIAVYIMDLSSVNEMMAEKHRAEVSRENSEAKSRFLAYMSHEIRTPITAVLGIAEIQLQDPCLPMHQEEAFAKIFDSASTLLGIVNDILDLSKIEAGKMDLIESKYEMASLINDVAQLHLAYMGSKLLAFQVYVDENIPACLIGDELRIRQVLNNILSNAFKYTEKGSVKFAVAFEKVNDPNENKVNIIFTIADTGKGMSQEQLAALFNEYQRFHEEEVRSAAGTGLGMPIVMSLIQLMEGNVTVESDVGQGTTVRVTIPQKVFGNEVLGAESADNLKHFENQTGSSKKFTFTAEPMPYGRVLIVDDVETNLFVASGLMSFYELNIETATGGREAIAKIKDGNVYDIIFMDHMMPELNGMETTKILRDMGYLEPIVALTANALIGQAEEFMRNGFDGFVSKPIQTAHLNGILNKFIKDKFDRDEEGKAARMKWLESRHQEGSKTKVDGDKSISSLQLTDDISGMNNFMNNPDIVKKLNLDFAQSQRNVIGEIIFAHLRSDYETAARLAHTVKGLAGLINENDLIEIAGQVEKAFKEGEFPEEILGVMELRINEIIASIDERYGKESKEINAAEEFDRRMAAAVLDEISKMLDNRNAGVIEFVPELELIPMSEKLIGHIDSFDFSAAKDALKNLRTELGI